MHEQTETRKRTLLAGGLAMLLIGLVGAVYTLLALHEARSFLRADRITGEHWLLIGASVTSVLLFFLGGGLLVNHAVNRQKLERVQRRLVTQLTMSAVCIALSMVLSQIRLYRMPHGGSVTALSMLFIVLVGYWFGARAGFLAGVACGLLRLMTDPWIVHPIQFIMDYPLAYGLLGSFPFFRNKRYGLQISYTLGVFGSFISHFIAGAVFFASTAPEVIAGQNILVYSALYNLTHLGPEALITLIIISIPTVQNAIDRLTPIRKKIEAT